MINVSSSGADASLNFSANTETLMAGVFDCDDDYSLTSIVATSITAEVRLTTASLTFPVWLSASGIDVRYCGHTTSTIVVADSSSNVVTNSGITMDESYPPVVSAVPTSVLQVGTYTATVTQKILI